MLAAPKRTNAAAAALLVGRSIHLWARSKQASAPTSAAEEKRRLDREKEEEKEYAEREKRSAWLTPRGLRKVTFGTSALTLGLLPCECHIEEMLLCVAVDSPLALVWVVEQTAC